MNKLNSIAVAFAAGSGGGLATLVTAWLFGMFGLTAALGVDLKLPLDPPHMYHFMVWGGIFGFMFLLPLMRGSVVLRGIIFGVAPSVVQCLIVFPVKHDAGMLGMQLGALTPVFVLIFNTVWGIVTGWLFVKARGE